MLSGKKIILGVSGSIAAYKAVYLLRLLVKAGAEVQVLLTKDAAQFVGSITFSTLSKRPVHMDISGEEEWNNHVEMGLWADLMIIAPVTANTIAKMSRGICDNVLLATYLSARCPVWIAPAMDLDMWDHASTQRNIKTLQGDGVTLIPVDEGELASGLRGAGRMAEPAAIFDLICNFLASPQELAGKKILVTAGPTYEDLDPVRYIGNRSSGKMGIAIALAAVDRGAHVDLILGPSHMAVPDHARLQLHRVRSAQEMADAAIAKWSKCDVAVMAAAVADYRPVAQSDEKIKKKEGELNLPLERTLDIAGALGASKRQNEQRLIGFALETENLIENARSKMSRKGFDMIVANSPKDPGAGFQHDTNKVTLLWPDGAERGLDLMSKTEVARHIVDEVVNLLETSS